MAILSHVSRDAEVSVVLLNQTPPAKLQVTIDAHRDSLQQKLAVDVYDITEDAHPHYLATVVIEDVHG